MTTNFDRRNFLEAVRHRGGRSVAAQLCRRGRQERPRPAGQADPQIQRLEGRLPQAMDLGQGGAWHAHRRTAGTRPHCAWDVYVKDGLVFREEQAGEYPKVNDELPDYNPRGCQKGGCYSQRMYDPTRVTHPLRRVGERGSGKWERVHLGRGADRYRRYLARCGGQGRHRPGHLGRRSQCRFYEECRHFVAHGHADAVSHPRRESRDRRRPARHLRDLRQDYRSSTRPTITSIPT